MELLVHLSAPTTRRDDDRYEAQATAYHDFEPASVVYMTRRGSGEEEGIQDISDNPSGKDLDAPPQTSRKPSNEAGDAPSNESLTGRLQLPDEASSTVPRQHVAGIPHGSSWSSMLAGTPLASSRRIELTKLDSAFSSSRNAIEQLERLQSSHRRQQRSSGRYKSPAPRSSGLPARMLPSWSSPEYIEDTQLAVAALESQIVPSAFDDPPSSPSSTRSPKRRRTSGDAILPASGRVISTSSGSSPLRKLSEPPEYPPADEIGIPVEGSAASELPSELGLSHSYGNSWTSGVALRAGNSQEDNQAADGPGLPSSSQTVRKQADVYSSSPSKRHIRRASLPSPAGPPLRIVNNMDQTVEALSPPKDQQAAEPERLQPVSDKAAEQDTNPPKPINLSTLPMAYYAPPPETDSIKIPAWPSQITPALSRVFEGVCKSPDIVLKRRTREISPVERGYWLIDPSTWPLDIQADFWRIVGDNIETGACGWSVWCTQETSSEFPACEEMQAKGGLGVVRFWCWGEVVPHVWAFLVVASQMWVKYTGARWIGMKNEVVVDMPAAPSIRRL